MKQVLYKGMSTKYLGITFHIVAEAQQHEEVVNMLNRYGELLQSEGQRNINITYITEETSIIDEVLYTLYVYHMALTSDTPIPRMEVYTEQIGYKLSHLNPFTSPLSEVKPLNLKLVLTEMCGEFGSSHSGYDEGGSSTTLTSIKEWIRQKNMYGRNLKHTKVIASSISTIGAKHIYERGVGLAYSTLNYDIEVALYDNLCDAINQKELHYHKGQLIVPEGAIWSRDPYLEKTRLKAEFINDTLVVSDNTTAINSIRETLQNSQNICVNYDIVCIAQYTITHSNGYGLIVPTSGGVNVKAKYARFTLLNKDRILAFKQDRYFDTNRVSYLSGTIQYKKTKYKTFNVAMKIFPFEHHKVSHYVVPFEKDKDTHIECFKFLDDLMSNTTLNDGSELLMSFPAKFLLQSVEGDDVLVKWFNMAASNAQSDEEKLRKAYLQLKEGLVKEFREVELFLANNNVTNKKPIPSITIEPELARNGMKKIAFSLIPRKLHSIGYRELPQCINYKTMIASFIIPVHSGKTKLLLRGETSLEKLYNKKNNNITITIDGLKKGMDREC